jgi:Ca2+/Na+ antiporter
MDNTGKIFSIIFAIGFIFFAIEVLTSEIANFFTIFFFVIVPVLIVIFVTLKNRHKPSKKGG